MASAPTHIVATAAIAACFHRPGRHWQLWTTGAVRSFARFPEAEDYEELLAAYRDWAG